jgi:hypothetical protein
MIVGSTKIDMVTGRVKHFPPEPEKKGMSLHKKISFFKSGVRIVAYLIGCAAFVHNTAAFMAFYVLVLSEIVGIYEEVGEK